MNPTAGASEPLTAGADRPSAATSPTEQRLAATVAIDEVTTIELLQMINDEDAKVASAVRTTFDVLSELVETAEAAVRAGHRIHYFGAGTSGRFGVLDAAEVPPTYGVGDSLVVAHLAGGAKALTSAVEDAEDDAAAGADEALATVRPGDVAFGLAASGRTPYVLGALRAARSVGARTIAVTSNPTAALADHADYHLYLPTGPEAITGSTRMKAGTAQKILLHTFSTALMVRLGRTFSNLMVDVVATNGKLRDRVSSILQEAAGTTTAAAKAALVDAGGDAKVATVMLLSRTDAATARSLLKLSDGAPRRAAKLGQERHPVTQPPVARQPLVVGIDVGASGYRLAVEGARVELSELRRGVRPQIHGRGVSLDNLLASIAADFRGLADHGTVECVGIGLAGGAFFAESAGRIAAAVAELARAATAVTMPDSVAAYVGAIGLHPGAVLAAGTGAVAVASDLKTQWRRIDGLGQLLGDYGSGARLGERALRLATATHAGRPTASPVLEAAARRRFGSISDLAEALYGTSERAAVLASFVPDVLDAAAAGDQTALALVTETADELATTLSAASADMPGTRSAIGGLVAPGSFIRGLLEARLSTAGGHLAEPLATPAAGAATIARAFRDGTLPTIIGAQLTGRFENT